MFPKSANDGFSFRSSTTRVVDRALQFEEKMKTNYKFFCNSKSLPVDVFFRNVLYDKKNGYYNIKSPIGDKGDYITAPKISKLFSEIKIF